MDCQKEIIELITKKTKELESEDNTRSWKKFIGDYFARVVKSYISKEISSSYKVTYPNAFISDIPIEYDLLIVKKDAKPARFTHSFYANDVYLGFELKTHGIFGGKKDLKNNIEKVKENFNTAQKMYSNIKFLYLTFKEVTNPVRKNSINYLKETEKYLYPYSVFCLSDSRKKTIIPGEWERFIKAVNQILK